MTAERRPVVVAIDGPAASGKGTLARRLAAALGLRHLDSGLFYRATALRLARAGGDASDEAAAAEAAAALTDSDLDDPALRNQDVSALASRVAAIPGVRAAVLERQRAWGRAMPGAVMDGRDIGTVVFPDAAVKLYLDAEASERAGRRHRELAEKGDAPPEASVAAELAERDRRDATRAVAPLRPAPDAVILDSTGLDADQVFARALAIVREKLANRA